MHSNRIACNFLIQSKLVARGDVGLTPGKKLRQVFLESF